MRIRINRIDLFVFY
jgi:Zn-dependent M16 (insulinase) family peptidase